LKTAARKGLQVRVLSPPPFLQQLTAAIKAAFGNASIVGNNHVVFNIGRNKYRLVVRVNYPYRVMCNGEAWLRR
jgi:HigB_toxin, RelE-like toxic component of a toxin-antitoxin system